MNRMAECVRFCCLLAVILMLGMSVSGCKNSNGLDPTPDSKTPLHLQSQQQARAISPPIDDSIVETQHFYSGSRELLRAHALPKPALLGGKVAYLTFDDGPSQSTSKILRILKEQHVKATFFVVGNEGSEGKALYKQIAADGHALGNHTYSHEYKTIYRSVDAFRRDARKLDRLLEETVGVKPDIIRFPGGSNNHLSWKPGGRGIMRKIAKAMQEDGYQYFDWNVSSTDAAAPVQDKEMIIASVIGASKGKQSIIVLMHDNTHKTTTVEALPVIIQKLKSDGFRFETLSRSSFTFQFLS
ncbi:polysaccharide deacetylase family protein [Paenibacillus hexagrammi]|uniref:Polysaccharide deacetylase n=1 Tax=Paenibacillus hexagrammi TaxID=2908839 RepID=A0ABY3SIM7_9BACL|nr:polysaccharide deacetylase family protein [Paenibacillus sp. YPD9-1]UJF32832.1 polysaccharide deacetylase [Paenibacillus sp. YPD9-1]